MKNENDKDFIVESTKELVLPEAIRYKCKKHGEMEDDTVTFVFSDGIQGGTYCLKCLTAFLEKSIGVLEEVKDEK